MDDVGRMSDRGERVGVVESRAASYERNERLALHREEDDHANLGGCPPGVGEWG